MTTPMAAAHPYQKVGVRRGPPGWNTGSVGKGGLRTLFGRGERAGASGLFVGARRRRAGIEDRLGALAASTPLGVFFLKGMGHGI